MFKFELGSPVTDSITGFTGVIVARGDYLHTTNTYNVQPVADGQANKKHDSEWFEESRLDLASVN